jgi:hypothetical protein
LTLLETADLVSSLKVRWISFFSFSWIPFAIRLGSARDVIHA